VNRTLVDEIAAAVLYEGYLLYPYRPSALKNQQRFNFGVVAPRQLGQSDEGGWFIQTECLVRAARANVLDLRARFLHLTFRTAASTGSIAAPRGWQEAIEREVPVHVPLDDLCHSPARRSFGWPAAQEVETLYEGDGIAAVIVRSCESLAGEINLQAEEVQEGLFRITVRISNVTAVPPTNDAPRGAELERALVSTHAVLHVADGAFVSLLDPPPDLQAIASACHQIGVWPVLVGDERDRDAVLAAPIILYDHPQIAQESAGDFFDGTEIDEMLVLRILTMTDAEKREMRGGDPRARRMLERTENLSDEQMIKLHGVLRGLQTLHDEGRR
jgi:hypothetical protein